MELLINRVGGLMVLLLTRVVGRAIGLVGRGVMQGLGQGLQNALPLANNALDHPAQLAGGPVGCRGVLAAVEPC